MTGWVFLRSFRLFIGTVCTHPLQKSCDGVKNLRASPLEDQGAIIIIIIIGIIIFIIITCHIYYSKLNPILSTSHTHTGGLFPRTAFNHRPRGVGTRGQEITFVTQARGSRNQEITFSTQARRSRNQEITCLTQARMSRDQETTFKIKARRSRNQEITFATQASYCSYKYR